MIDRQSCYILLAQVKELKSNFEDDSYKFIYVGNIVNDEKIEGIKDNTGDNISEKNKNYCELTALYWIWKTMLQKNSLKRSSVSPSIRMYLFPARMHC